MLHHVLQRNRRCVFTNAHLSIQYRRRALQTLVSHHVEKLRRAIRVAHLTLDD
jgi:hypothetical protein